MVELLFKPSIPDNIMNWRVFNDDSWILNFLTSVSTFKDGVIDNEKHEENIQECRDETSDTEAILVPKSVLSLEKLFDLQSKFRTIVKAKTNSAIMTHTLINLGTPKNPKFNLGTCCIETKIYTFTHLFKRYKDVFARTYEDLKTYDTHIIQHIIPIKEGVKPFQQKLKKVHPTLEPLIQKELKKLLNAQIIFKVHHSTWVSNMVPIRKKSREIKLCVDFWNLNQASEKDNYHVLHMEHILQLISGLEMFSLLDGFSCYNLVLVVELDQLKTTFCTKWATFAYRRMPFSLINAGVIFQHVMDNLQRFSWSKCCDIS